MQGLCDQLYIRQSCVCSSAPVVQTPNKSPSLHRYISDYMIADSD